MLKNGRILVVEDDEATAALQKTRLSRHGHYVEVVTDIEVASKKLTSGQFDLMLLDYTLGGELNGIDFYLALRERGINIPAILVTGFGDERVILRAMRAGVRDFLPKSIEYLDDLPLAVGRVLKQVATERQLIESEFIREKQEQLTAAFNAAKLGAWDWNLRTGVLRWSGFHQELFGLSPECLVRSFDELTSRIVFEDRAKFIAALEVSKEKGAPVDQILRVRRAANEGGERWFEVKGSFSSRAGSQIDRMTAVVMDITEGRQAEIELEHSYERIKALNERLKLSVTEAHHRVKNSLQTLSSLVNLQRGEAETLSAEGVEKIIANLQGIAFVHDALTHRSQEDESPDTPDIEITPILERVIGVVIKLSGERGVITELDGCSDCRVLGRHAASLAVIVNELFSNALKHGAGKIWITVRKVSRGKGTLIFENEGSLFPKDFSPQDSGRTGLFLLSALCHSDFNSKPKFANSEDRACVKIDFPLWHPSDHESQEDIGVSTPVF